MNFYKHMKEEDLSFLLESCKDEVTKFRFSGIRNPLVRTGQRDSTLLRKSARLLMIWTPKKT